MLEVTKLFELVSEEFKEKSKFSEDVSIDLKLKGPEKSLLPDSESLLMAETCLQLKQTVVSHLLQTITFNGSSRLATKATDRGKKRKKKIH